MDKQIAVSLNKISKKYRLYMNKADRFYESIDPLKRKYHKEFYSLKTITLDIYRGETLGIIGTNGAGKSTLLKIISGVLTPSSGNLEVSGNVVALLELGSGFNPELTGLENIYFYCSVIGLSRKEINERIDDIINFADIGDFIHQPLKIYSSGMRARLAFAASVHVNPDILVLDEILSVGDELFKRKCYARMEDFFKGERTVLYVSHAIETVNQLCNRAVLLDNGEIILDGPSKMVTSMYQKFINALAENKKNIRQEIIELNSDDKRKIELAESLITQRISKKNVVPKPVPVIDMMAVVPYYSDDLLSQSVVDIKNYDVDIFDIQIMTLNGDKVNHLVFSEEYIYTYKVRFDIEVERANFNMQIKTLSGLKIEKASYPSSITKPDKFVQNILSGTTYQISYRFHCILQPGTYFMNAGIAGVIKGQKGLLRAVVDAFVFKVISISDWDYSGIVHLIKDIDLKEIL